MNGFDLSSVTDIRLGSTTVSAVYYGSTKIWPVGAAATGIPSGWTVVDAT